MGICSDNPVTRGQKTQTSSGRDRRLPIWRAYRIWAWQHIQNPELRVIIIVAIESAMRQGEILSLMWENINLRVGVAHLPITKNAFVVMCHCLFIHKRSIDLTGSKSIRSRVYLHIGRVQRVFEWCCYRLKDRERSSFPWFFRHEAISRHLNSEHWIWWK